MKSTAAQRSRGLTNLAFQRSDIIAATVLFLITFAIFRVSPVQSVYDSRFTMFLSQTLLWKHSFSLEAGTFPTSATPLPFEEPNVPYQLLKVGNRFYGYYPPGASILSIPYVALANILGVSASDQNGRYNEAGEVRLQRALAALLMAGLSLIVFLTSRLVLPLPWSLLVSGAIAFGTQVWSTASRAIWSHTWGIFLLSLILWLLFRTETKKAGLHPGWLGTGLSWLYFIRPNFAVAIVAIALFILIYHPKNFLWVVATGSVWLALFIGYSEFHLHKLLPPYYQPGRLWLTKSCWEALLGSLISPSRGLLIFVPILTLIAYLLVRYHRYVRQRWMVLAVVTVAAHLMLTSFDVPWTGGHCYGPRLSTDLVPWFGLLAILAIEARLRWRKENLAQDSLSRVRAESIIAALLLGCGIILNGIGAISINAWWWNVRPTGIDQDPSRVWDWKRPQFLGAPSPSDG